MGGDILPRGSWGGWLDRFFALEKEFEEITTKVFGSLAGVGWENPFAELGGAEFSESGDQLVITLPVTEADDLNVLVNTDQVAIRGTVRRRGQAKDNSGVGEYLESFHRVVTLPAHVKPDTAETTIDEGRVTIKARKA